MLNVAVIGTGGISGSHINGFLTFPDRCQITALVDIYIEKAEKAKEKHKLEKAEIYDSYEELLGNPDIHLAAICTPPYTHAEMAIELLKAGKHVIVEKPMAASLEECDAMLAAEKASGKVLSVIAQNRFRDEFMKLKTVLESGKIGKVVHTQVDSNWWRGHSYYDLWWRGCWEKEGGGCTLNHAVHHIDMLSWLVGMPKKVGAIMSNAAHDNAEVEDISAASLLYPDGSMAQITSSLIHHGQDGETQQIVVQGEKARISAPWRVISSKAKPNGFPEENTEFKQELDDYHASLPSLKYEKHTAQIDDVLAAIETGRAPYITGEDGRATIELITAIYKAATEERVVELPIQKGDAFYTVEGKMEKVPHFFEKSTSKTELEGDISV